MNPVITRREGRALIVAEAIAMGTADRLAERPSANIKSTALTITTRAMKRAGLSVGEGHLRRWAFEVATAYATAYATTTTTSKEEAA